MGFFATWIVTTIATAAAIALVPGISAVGGSLLGPAVCALTLALVNAIIKPVIELLSLPLTIVTLGLFYLIINAFMLEIAGSLSVSLFGSGIAIDGFGSAFIGSIVISLASMLIAPVFGGDE